MIFVILFFSIFILSKIIQFLDIKFQLNLIKPNTVEDDIRYIRNSQEYWIIKDLYHDK
jgi:hypothetical protein